MTRISDLVAGLREDPTCVFAPPGGGMPSGLPDDLREFYELCGGLTLFTDSFFVWEIVGPREIVPTNLVLLGEQFEDDITSSWSVIAREPGDSGSLISIDLGADRLGWCYDSNADVHGLVGDCAVLAHSFTELLSELIEARGQHVFWTADDFVSKGDAYDSDPGDKRAGVHDSADSE